MDSYIIEIENVKKLLNRELENFEVPKDRERILKETCSDLDMIHKKLIPYQNKVYWLKLRRVSAKLEKVGIITLSLLGLKEIIRILVAIKSL